MLYNAAFNQLLGSLAFLLKRLMILKQLDISFLFYRFVPVDFDSPKDDEHPAQVAETVFRDLICRASFGNIKAILKPVLV